MLLQSIPMCGSPGHTDLVQDYLLHVLYRTIHLLCTALRGDKFPKLPQGRIVDISESLIYSIREARARQSIISVHNS